MARSGPRAAVQRQRLALQLARLLALGHRRAGQQRRARPRSLPLGPWGRSHEWHLNHDKPFGHLAFDLVAGFSQVREVPVVSFLSPGLVAIWAVGDTVGG